MKKFLFFVVVVFMSVMSLNAQTFVSVNKVAQEGNSFVAYGDNNISTPITAIQYQEMKKNGIQHYRIVEYIGVTAEKSFKGLLYYNEYNRELLTVDSVCSFADSVKVFFTDGSFYLSKSPSWTHVLEGQKVAHIEIKSSFRDFEKYEALKTVPADFEENFGLYLKTVANLNSFKDLASSTIEQIKLKVEEKVEDFIEPKTTPKTTERTFGKLKFIEE